MTEAEIWIFGDPDSETVAIIGHRAQFLPLNSIDDPSTIIIFADGSRALQIFDPDYILIIIREEAPL